jgi:hypothetical protein
VFGPARVPSIKDMSTFPDKRSNIPLLDPLYGMCTISKFNCFFKTF